MRSTGIREAVGTQLEDATRSQINQLYSDSCRVLRHLRKRAINAKLKDLKRLERWVAASRERRIVAGSE